MKFREEHTETSIEESPKKDVSAIENCDEGLCPFVRALFRIWAWRKAVKHPAWGIDRRR
jgi:hypothetical protein